MKRRKCQKQNVHHVVEEREVNIMKFENFVKKAVPYGVTILTKSDGNWLFANGIFANIPDMLGTIGRISNDPETVQILNGHLYESELHGEAF